MDATGEGTSPQKDALVVEPRERAPSIEECSKPGAVVGPGRKEDGVHRVEGPDGHSTATDMPRSVGGANGAPSPGWLFRAALASCEGTLIAMRAAQAGIDLSLLEEVVDSESDDRGILGMGS